MSFTGIGRIGSQHTLTSPQDNDLYLFQLAMWCTHPLLGKDFIDTGSIDLTEGSKIVTGVGTLFTILCNDIQMNNVPLNKYIAYRKDTSYGILEVDYVLDDATLVLKYPAFETIGTINKASLIDYWGTPILKEVDVRLSDPSTGGVLVFAAKYSANQINLFDMPFTSSNEGGVEPMLFTGDGSIIVTLKY